MTRIYLDHAATTPLRPEAAEAMRHGFEIWANPSSPHAEGRKARAALEDARARVKSALGWDGEVIFTSGASEAAALALGQAKADRRLVSAVEHDAVKKGAAQLSILPVDTGGSLDLAALEQSLDAEGSVLLAVQSINSETGNRQDISAIAAHVHEHGGLVLADCAQSAGKYPLPAEADMAIVSAQKLGGPIGIGALLVRDYAMLAPTGGQERGYRRGTENLPGAMAFAAALEACAEPWAGREVVEPFDMLAQEVRSLGGCWLADRLTDPTPYVRAIAMPEISGSAQLMRFDMQGIAVSQGSACSSGTMKTSPVLEAMGVDADLASRTIRVSIGWNTTRGEVDRFAQAWMAMARDARDKAA
ncbi:cysteine desulfurase [Altererythrobacter atlanticus]|uniref:Cysteine desulfurase n=1 Tax=Croceibacterium atlanticum TaxID=1267766 RepID=A0A0F7KSD5_9SPHN|nr:aminotransferase class V-fold PLP-dependent enzyme [Croceibacterium atlanticum]AKH42036.1 Cysteine desulfurase [Croceibacterium atlanticum]MBB5733396.1 cysteine desulfurase [Croceibacterium atlanticum]